MNPTAGNPTRCARALSKTIGTGDSINSAICRTRSGEVTNRTALESYTSLRKWSRQVTDAAIRILTETSQRESCSVSFSTETCGTEKRRLL
jgi:hypothetical protein